MNNAQNNQVSTNTDDADQNTAPKAPVAIDLTESKKHASDEGADASKKADGRGPSAGWGAGTH